MARDRCFQKKTWPDYNTRSGDARNRRFCATPPLRPYRVFPLNDTCTPDDYRWLTSDEAAPWLARAAEGQGSTVQLTAELRRSLTAPRAHLVLEQNELRARGRRKFAAAAQMFFTRQGLEQATDELVARYKAGRFLAEEPVADLCCGVGGDLFGLAARGTAIGVDREPRLVILAQANLRTLNISRCDMLCQNVEDFAARSVGAWHIDPDRRATGRRSTRVEQHEPGPEAIDRLRDAQPAGAVKLAPAATLPEAWCAEAEQEWISRDGECRQLVCWFGRLASAAGKRRATIVDRAGRAARTLVGEPRDWLPVADRLGKYLYEPDAAVLAAGLTGTLIDEHGLAAVAPHIAYFTGDTLVADAALSRFAVLEVLPFDVRQVRAALAARQIGRLEIKQRGRTCEPEQLRKTLRPKGENAATLIVTPHDGRRIAILAERLMA